MGATRHFVIGLKGSALRSLCFVFWAALLWGLGFRGLGGLGFGGCRVEALGFRFQGFLFSLCHDF